MFDREQFKEVVYEKGQLMVADYLSYTRSHGPGNRFALWLQGCLKYCPDCINPGMLKVLDQKVQLPHRIGLTSQADLTEEIRIARDSVAEISGLTIMGGEPVLQARNLVPVLETLKIKDKPSMNILLFSGYTLEELRAFNNQAINDLLALTDTLIDGEYVQEEFDPSRIAGSANQRIIHFTDALRDADFSRKGREQFIQLATNKLSKGISSIKV